MAPSSRQVRVHSRLELHISSLRAVYLGSTCTRWLFRNHLGRNANTGHVTPAHGHGEVDITKITPFWPIELGYSCRILLNTVFW